MRNDITYKIYRKAYLERVKKKNKSKIWACYVNRPIAFWPTLFFLKFDLSPNTATFISGLAVLIGGVYLAMGGMLNMIIGTIITGLWLVFDSVDGSIARYHNKCSTYGEFFDAICGYLMIVVTFPCYGYGVYRQTGDVNAVVIGFILALLGIFPRLIYQKMLTYSSKADGTGVQDILEGDPDKITIKTLLVMILSNISDVGGFVIPIMLISVIFNLTYYYMICYLMIYSLICIMSIAKFMLHVKKTYN